MELNIPFSRFSFLRRSFSWGIGRLIAVASPFFSISFSANIAPIGMIVVTFFFIIIRRRSGTFFRCGRFNAFNAVNALSTFCCFFRYNFFCVIIKVKVCINNKSLWEWNEGKILLNAWSLRSKGSKGSLFIYFFMINFMTC